MLCERCRKAFEPDPSRPTKRFCSKRCRQIEYQRRQMERHPEKKLARWRRHGRRQSLRRRLLQTEAWGVPPEMIEALFEWRSQKVLSTLARHRLKMAEDISGEKSA